MKYSAKSVPTSSSRVWPVAATVASFTSVIMPSGPMVTKGVEARLDEAAVVGAGAAQVRLRRAQVEDLAQLVGDELDLRHVALVVVGRLVADAEHRCDAVSGEHRHAQETSHLRVPLRQALAVGRRPEVVVVHRLLLCTQSTQMPAFSSVWSPSCGASVRLERLVAPGGERDGPLVVGDEVEEADGASGERDCVVEDASVQLIVAELGRLRVQTQEQARLVGFAAQALLLQRLRLDLGGDVAADGEDQPALGGRDAPLDQPVGAVAMPLPVGEVPTMWPFVSSARPASVLSRSSGWTNSMRCRPSTSAAG